ncbi:DUF3810 domain-containing protein [Apibacter sp. HY039]|uniref:DUF3810 domain-containing protein n=1 Tax=Apibacter sp. HY039 TaxID=2501476 RepID=UPI000FEC1E82|nr:DUF3810 domain-containing protein [Apibacter sp. HY039]
MKKIRVNIEGLISSLILQFFLYQIIKMSIGSGENFYTRFLLKIKSVLNSIFGLIPFSIGDCLYFLLGIFFVFCLFKGILLQIKKKKQKASKYFVAILFTINIFYCLFMLSFGLLYNSKQFVEFDKPEDNLYEADLKVVANYLLNNCLELRKNVSTNKEGEFAIDTREMITALYKEQSSFFETPEQHPNVKVSMYSSIMRKVGVAGYYNPFTGEAQFVEGYPDTSIPFTIAHEMGHQAGIAGEGEANFYSFYMGENSLNKEFQYSVKYKALMFILREIYNSDSLYYKRISANFSEGMKKDREREIKFYSQSSNIGSDLFLYMNDTYLKSNNQEGVLAYSKVVKMIVNFYKYSYPSLFAEAKQSQLPINNTQ